MEDRGRPERPHFFMSKIKEATTIQQQITKLEERGMTVNDKAEAEEILSDIGYYRLGFYWAPLEKGYLKWRKSKLRNRSHEFEAGADFDTAVMLYYFDHDLRAILTPYLHRIEIHLRTTLIYIVSNHYKSNPIWFADPKIVESDFLAKLPAMYADIRKNDVIKHHHRKYRKDLYAPAWKTIEYMTFGGVLYLIDNLKDINLQQKISNKMGIKNLNAFRSQVQVLRNLRNICAHGHNLFDWHLSLPFDNGRIKGLSKAERSSAYGAIVVLADILGNISLNRKRDLINEVNKLLSTATGSDIAEYVKHLRLLPLP